MRSALGEHAENFDVEVHNDILAQRVHVLLLSKRNDLLIDVGLDTETIQGAIASEVPAGVECRVTRVRGIKKEAAETVLMLGGIEPLLKMLETFDGEERGD